mmetsp:Transcript_38193/g.77244  ORF Transcript_38193/g.77244 Transcript_38193/m.77244 type:complete len:209 (-) Transcript_38193:507-1133(-)
MLRLSVRLTLMRIRCVCSPPHAPRLRSSSRSRSDGDDVAARMLPVCLRAGGGRGTDSSGMRQGRGGCGRGGMRHASAASWSRWRLRSAGRAPRRNSARSSSSEAAGSSRSINDSASLRCGSGRPSRGGTHTACGSWRRSGLSSKRNAFSTGSPRFATVAVTSLCDAVTTTGGASSRPSSHAIASRAAIVRSSAFFTSSASSSSSSTPR